MEKARAEAETAAGGIAMKLAQWRQLALSPDIGLGEEDLVELAPAFEHEDAQAARALTR